MAEHAPGPWKQGPYGIIKTVYGYPNMDESQLTPVLLLGRGICRDANARLILAAPAYKIVWSLVPEDIREAILSQLDETDRMWISESIAEAEGRSDTTNGV